MSANTTIETLDLYFNKLLSDCENLEKCIVEIEKIYVNESISMETLQKLNRQLFFQLNIVNRNILAICTILDIVKLDQYTTNYLDVQDYLFNLYDDKLFLVDNYFDVIISYTYKYNFNSVFQNLACMYSDILSDFFDDNDDNEFNFEDGYIDSIDYT